jgi:DNA-binding response OmpR family regulator
VVEGKRILIVDDEVGIVDVLAAILTDEGYVVDTAPNGREALASIARRRPALVLLDTMMPMLDGMETLRAIREDPELAGVRVLLMTAMGSFPHRAGVPPADGHLFKPFELDTFLERVTALVGAPRSERP